MCIFNLKTAEKQIAKEDIVVLKVIKIDDKGKLISPIFDDEVWQLGNEKTIDLKIIRDGFEYHKELYMSTEGFYSFHKDSDPKYCTFCFSHVNNNKLEVYEAIIPKGAEYINVGSVFCSNKLKLIKKIL